MENKDGDSSSYYNDMKFLQIKSKNGVTNDNNSSSSSNSNNKRTNKNVDFHNSTNTISKSLQNIDIADASYLMATDKKISTTTEEFKRFKSLENKINNFKTNKKQKIIEDLNIENNNNKVYEINNELKIDKNKYVAITNENNSKVYMPIVYNKYLTSNLVDGSNNTSNSNTNSSSPNSSNIDKVKKVYKVKKTNKSVGVEDMSNGNNGNNKKKNNSSNSDNISTLIIYCFFGISFTVGLLYIAKRYKFKLK